MDARFSASKPIGSRRWNAGGSLVRTSLAADPGAYEQGDLSRRNFYGSKGQSPADPNGYVAAREEVVTRHGRGQGAVHMPGRGDDGDAIEWGDVMSAIGDAGPTRNVSSDRMLP